MWAASGLLLQLPIGTSILADSYTFHWIPVIEAMPRLLGGVVTALEVAAVSMVGATIIAFCGALAARSARRPLRVASVIYLESMRNSPSLVKMYFLYFGLGSFGIYLPPFVAASAALALQNGAYMMEIVRGSIAAIPVGQRDAARSLGLSPRQIFFKVILPQALRNALPALGNNWVEIVKDTSLTSALSVAEVYFVFQSVMALDSRVYELLIVLAAIYLILTAAVSASVQLLERRLGRPYRVTR
jgi:His/Glu/Gln/Arg/opine family amino acid ABC transporter permease subunit